MQSRVPRARRLPGNEPSHRLALPHKDMHSTFIAESGVTIPSLRIKNDNGLFFVTRSLPQNTARHGRRANEPPPRYPRSLHDSMVAQTSRSHYGDLHTKSLAAYCEQKELHTHRPCGEHHMPVHQSLRSPFADPSRVPFQQAQRPTPPNIPWPANAHPAPRMPSSRDSNPKTISRGPLSPEQKPKQVSFGRRNMVQFRSIHGVGGTGLAHWVGRVGYD